MQRDTGLVREAIDAALGQGPWLVYVRHEATNGRVSASFPERFPRRRDAGDAADYLCRHGHDARVLDLRQVPK